MQANAVYVAYRQYYIEAFLLLTMDDYKCVVKFMHYAFPAASSVHDQHSSHHDMVWFVVSESE